MAAATATATAAAVALASPAAIRASPVRRGLVSFAPALRSGPDRISRAVALPGTACRPHL